MKHADLEHALQASKAVAADSDFVVGGSQAILGRLPDDLVP